MNGWDVFSNFTTTNTILYSGSTAWNNSAATSSPFPLGNVVYGDPLLVEGAPKPKDPLRWLHDRVSEVCDLGRLN